eukprot:6400-Heterococcus_DN1.PRE.1
MHAQQVPTHMHNGVARTLTYCCRDSAIASKRCKRSQTVWQGLVCKTQPSCANVQRARIQQRPAASRPLLDVQAGSAPAQQVVCSYTASCRFSKYLIPLHATLCACSIYCCAECASSKHYSNSLIYNKMLRNASEETKLAQISYMVAQALCGIAH